MDADIEVVVYDHLVGLGFTDQAAIAIALRCLLRHLVMDLTTLRECAAEAGYQLPATTCSSLSFFKDRN